MLKYLFQSTCPDMLKYLFQATDPGVLKYQFQVTNPGMPKFLLHATNPNMMKHPEKSTAAKSSFAGDPDTKRFRRPRSGQEPEPIRSTMPP